LISRRFSVSSSLGKVSEFDRRALRQLHQQSCILEKHEKQIAQHTAIQSQIAGWQLFIGAVTTGALIYIAYQQYIAAERQVTLEYAKVAPQFAISATLQPTVKGSAIAHAFPENLQVRIRRGEATVESVKLVQEIRLVRLFPVGAERRHDTCVIRVTNYFDTKTNSSTEFTLSQAAKRIPLDPIWHQDEKMSDFVILSPHNTLMTINYVDLFDEKRSVKFAGNDGKLEQIPSGDFAKSNLYETVDATIEDTRIRIPKYFTLQGAKPRTAGCRSQFGLKGGTNSFLEIPS
jgi:hypothetical protein